MSDPKRKVSRTMNNCRRHCVIGRGVEHDNCFDANGVHLNPALREPTPSVDPPKHECKVNEERIVCSCGVNLGITMGTDNPFWFAEAVCFIFAQHLLESRGSQAHEK